MSYLDQAKQLLTDEDMKRSVLKVRLVERAVLAIIDHLEEIEK